MKRSNLLIVLLAILAVGTGAGVFYRVAHSAKRERSSSSSPEAHPETLGPVIFASLPSKASYAQYAERIHTLGYTVSEQEQKSLIAWIIGPKPAHFQDRQWHFLVNEVMDSLCHQAHPLSSWTDVLIGIVQGKANDIVLRDYAIQHFADWIVPVHPNDPCETRPEKRQAILFTMLEAAGQTKESFSGTALQGLHLILLARQRSQQQSKLSAELPWAFSVEQLRPLAIASSTGDNVTDLARITALQVCAQRGFTEILPTARAIAGDPAKPVVVRISAIAAIGQMGNAGDEALLKKVQEERNHRFLSALQSALKRIRQPAVTAINATP